MMNEKVVSLGENPTPEEVRDFYDLHTAEGADNFSHTGGGFAVQLWHSLAQALKDKTQLEEEKEQQAQTIVDCQKRIAQLSCQLEDDLLKGLG